MKYPIGLSIILNALAAISILSGCSDYLDREYDSFIDNEMTFTSYERTSKFLVNAYRYLPDGFNRIGSEAMLDAATDDAEHANATSSTSTPEPGIQGPIRMICGISITQEFA